MPSTYFTELSVRKIKPPPKPQRIDLYETLTKGLALTLRISYGGSRTWWVITYKQGRAKSHKLGTYPRLNVKDARKAAFEFDPERASASVEAGTFKKVAQAYVEQYVVENNLRSKGEIERHLKVYVYPNWEHRPLFAIQRIDVTQLLLQIKNKHGKSQAIAAFSTLRSVLNWYAATDARYIPPLARKMADSIGLKKPEPRDRILDDKEIRAVWEATDKGDVVFAAFIKMLLLTGQRREKVVSMRWSDVDLDTGLWTVATEAREKGNVGKVVLPKMALDILREHPHAAESPYVFYATAGKKQAKKAMTPLKKPLGSFSQRKRELDKLLPAQMPHWTLHDLRRTARSLLARAKVSDDIAKRTVGHKLDGMDRIYNRHAYVEEKTDALARLASLLELILNPPANNVVPIATAR